MCSECLQVPCPCGCPNAPEPVGICDCSCCRLEVIEGERFCDVGGEFCHIDCLEEMPIEDVIRLFGCYPLIAEKESEW